MAHTKLTDTIAATDTIAFRPRRHHHDNDSGRKAADARVLQVNIAIERMVETQRGAPQIGGYGGDPPLKYRFREGRRTFWPGYGMVNSNARATVANAACTRRMRNKYISFALERTC